MGKNMEKEHIYGGINLNTVVNGNKINYKDLLIKKGIY